MSKSIILNKFSLFDILYSIIFSSIRNSPISDNPNDLIRNYKPHGILVLVSAEQIYNVTKIVISTNTN